MLSMEQALKDLVGMARQNTARSRLALAENVLDLFVSPDGRLSEHERAQADAILGKLVADMEMQIRAGLAERLADASNAPPKLLEMLANDEISIARPILERSKLLQDAALIEIVLARGREHQLAISIRENVPHALSNALIARGEPDVIESLVRNPKAQLSRQALAHLVAESRRFDRFQQPLLSRADLPPGLAHRMFWFVSAALRQAILSEFKLSACDLDPPLEIATKIALADTETARQSNRQQTAEQLAGTLHQNGQLSIDTLINMLRKQRLQAFTASMSSLAGIPFTAVNRIILDPAIEPFAVLCKAIGISQPHFFSMALLLQQARTGKSQSLADLQGVLDLFNKILSEQARITLQYWHKLSELPEALAVMH